MTQRIPFWNWGGIRASHRAINANADELDMMGTDVAVLKRVVRQQADDILWLRATVMGVVELLQNKLPFEEAALETAVRAAHRELTAPEEAPEPRAGGAPYRDGDATEAAAEPRVVLRTCIRCQRQVLASRITVFPDGEVCDSCL